MVAYLDGISSGLQSDSLTLISKTKWTLILEAEISWTDIMTAHNNTEIKWIMHLEW